jgi:hypothetical protein
MSCSTNRMPTSPRRLRRRSTIRRDSSALIPAVGSSRRSSRGSEARAIPTSSWRRSPWERLATGTSRRPSRPTRAAYRSASSRSSHSASTGLQNPKAPPFLACTTSCRFPRTVSWGKRLVTWKVRAIPKRALRCAGSVVTSCPQNTILPSSGGNTPATRLVRVVLPAPLGPMRAWISPGRTSREHRHTATSPPKRLVSPSTFRRLTGASPPGDLPVPAVPPAPPRAGPAPRTAASAPWPRGRALPRPPGPPPPAPGPRRSPPRPG